MANQKSRLDPKILILFMVLGLLPLGVGSLVLISGARDDYIQANNQHLSELADNAQVTLSNYLQRLIVQVAALGTVPEVREVVLRSNPQPLTDAQQQLEQQWDGLDVNQAPQLRNLLGNPASRFLRDYIALVPSFREIIVTDILGRTVAATNKTSDYLQSDERWWAYAYRQGAGGHFLGDLHFDASVEAYAIEIAEPIVDEATNSCVGVVKVVVDAQEIFGLVNSIEVGGGGQAALIRGADGMVVVSRDLTAERQEKFPYYVEVRTAAANNRGSVQVGEGDDRLFVGLPSTRLKDSFPELDWYLVVEQPYEQAYGSFLNIRANFIWLVVFSVLLVGILSLVFSRLLARPVIETDPHLEQL